jgi:hypothetical protein
MRRRGWIVAAVAVAATLALAAVASAAPQVDRVVGLSYVPKGGDGTDSVTGDPIPNGHFFVIVNALSASGRPGAGTLWFDILDLSTPVVWRGSVHVECVSVYDDFGTAEATVAGTLQHPMDWNGEQLDHVSFTVFDYGPNPTASDPLKRKDYWETSFYAGTGVVYDPSSDCAVEDPSTVTAGTYGPFGLGPAQFGNFVLLNGF